MGRYNKAEVGTYQSSEPIHIGLIHGTYQVKTDVGIFCLQSLHPKLASDGILRDYKVVTAHLARHQFPAPQLICDREGHPAYTDQDGVRWRLITWLDGNNTSEVTSQTMVASGAALFGRFHHVMADLEYSFQSTHPLHDTAHHLAHLRTSVQNSNDSLWLKKIAEMVDVVEQHLPSLVLPTTLPKWVVHGDPKISNMLFDHRDQASALLDLDTCTRHSPLVDLGDAVRSWCCTKHPDATADFHLDRYRSLMEGYASSGPKFDPQTLALLPQAGLLITLELASRFLADVLQDSYFAWDPTLFSSRKEHNFHRAKTMISFAQKLEQALPQQQEIVETIFTVSS